MDPVVKEVVAAGGVAQAKVLLFAVLHAGQITSAVAKGSLVRLARGIYSVPAADASLAFARILHAELGCVSAATELKLWVVRNPA